MSRLRLFVLGLAGVLAPLGCAWLAGLDGDRNVDATTGTGGAACGDALLERPLIPDIGGDGSDLFLALSAVRFGERELPDAGLPKIGLDLDHACGCSPKCEPPAWIDAQAPCDAQAPHTAIDNATSQAFHSLNEFNGILRIDSDQMTKDVATNTFWSLIIRVRHYGGGEADDHVEVALYPVDRLTADVEKDAGIGSWPIVDTGLGASKSIDEPLFVDKSAYVVKGTLVARLPGARIVMNTPSTYMVISLTSVILTANISKDMEGYQLTQGTLAGEWRLQDFFASMSSLRLNGGDSRFCMGNGLYEGIKKIFCQAVDQSAPGSQSCDALSFGMGFDAKPAYLHLKKPPQIVPEPPPPVGALLPACTDPDGGGSTDPINDSCEKP